MIVHKEHCTICQTYVEHAVDASKGSTVPIIEDEAITEVYHLCNWYCDQSDNLARRVKTMEEKLSSKTTQCRKA